MASDNPLMSSSSLRVFKNVIQVLTTIKSSKRVFYAKTIFLGSWRGHLRLARNCGRIWFPYFFYTFIYLFLFIQAFGFVQAKLITTGVEKKKKNAATSISEVRILKVHNSSFCVLTHGAKPLTTNIRSYFAFFWDVCLSVLEQRRNSIESGELDVDLLLFGVFCYKKPNLQTNLLLIHLANNSTLCGELSKLSK